MSIGPSAAARPSKATASVTLAAVARILAGQGSAGIADALQLVAAAVGCDHVQLRAGDATTVLATTRRDSGPAGRGSLRLDIPVRRTGELYGVLSVAAGRPLTDADAGLLAAVADTVGLTLAADGALAAWSAGRSVLDEEADRAQVAATLLDGIGEALVSVRYAAELVAAGEEDRSALEEPVRAALAALRHAHRDLRAHALEAGLRAALRELPDRWAGDRPDDGMSELRLSVDADDPALDALAPPIAVTVQRVAEAALRGATGRAAVRAGCEGKRVKLTVDSAEIAYDASELNRWARRALALGGDLRLRPDGVELSLPAELPPDRPPAQREGRHDDGSDL
ncbi:MAG TPA: hypothetical protein VH274_01600 [Mycobacteriales bacterium]|nr:hypothetical protein [Mycobacteriales bacterium]